MKIFSKVAVLFLLIVILFSQSVIYAEGTEQLKLPNVTVNPGSFYYPFKRLIEKGRERLVFSRDSKKSFYTSLLKTRLAELNFVVNNKMLSEIQSSSERFAYQAGILSEELIKQNNTSGKENLIKEFDTYSKFLDTLRDKYPANSSFWMLIQHDINTLKILSESLR